MAKDPAASFDEMIKAGRLRKKNEALAEQIFGKGRSGSGMGGRKASSTPPSLASRIGVTKRTVSATTKSNIDDKWSHDLHHKNNPHASRVSQLPVRHNSARITRDNRLYAALQSDITPNSALDNQINIRGAANGISIRGSAGPYVVIASNFAPGTTAADIRSALEQHVTDIITCVVLSAAPTVIAEIVFRQRTSADTVITTFNNQLADGRTLHVYLKNGPPTVRPKPTPTGPRASSGAAQRERTEAERRDADVDMQDSPYRPSEERRNRNNRGEKGLYSDRYNERYRW
ncbi:hypothetical protein GP486_004610 [Trichoglossum hirsutum]|uniref:RRM domain-containing protein n=1 Tax=Trichoglossum hirsutum TaxID=265104 RepID=A0A9P8LAK6_9PEZI|nr:hypothetical protein GP486_004610 [Trichoglossum hirsutum]